MDQQVEELVSVAAPKPEVDPKTLALLTPTPVLGRSLNVLTLVFGF